MILKFDVHGTDQAEIEAEAEKRVLAFAASGRRVVGLTFEVVPRVETMAGPVTLWEAEVTVEIGDRGGDEGPSNPLRRQRSAT